MNAVRKERFEFRLPEAAKRRIEEAAVISKVSVSHFVMESATFRADTVINEHRRLIVEEDVWEQVMAALERPPAPTQSMCKAFERYNSEESWICD